jgi:hypothetical protein
VVANRPLKRICGGPKREKVTGENCMMRSFIICTLKQIFLGWSNQGIQDKQVMWLVLG